MKHIEEDIPKDIPYKKLIAFNYFGGKHNSLKWLLPLLPKSYSYVEPFGGSAVVLLNRAPSKIETYNDISSEIVNFFRVLRGNPVGLCEQIYFTPYSKEEYRICFHTLGSGSDIERARKFFVCVNQSFSATIGRYTGWKFSTKSSRNLIAEPVSRWLNKLPKLAYIIERLKEVQIQNEDFESIIKKTDSKETLLTFQ